MVFSLTTVVELVFVLFRDPSTKTFVTILVDPIIVFGNVSVDSGFLFNSAWGTTPGYYSDKFIGSFFNQRT